MFEFIQKYLKSNKEFEIRFAIVIILNYYIEKEYLKRDFEIFDSINSKKYYAQMAIAWAISICLIKFYDETIKYLENGKLDKFTYNKSLQKAIESYRITNEQKEFLESIGCDFVQGYIYSKPIKINEFEEKYINQQNKN